MLKASQTLAFLYLGCCSLASLVSHRICLFIGISSFLSGSVLLQPSLCIRITQGVYERDPCLDSRPGILVCLGCHNKIPQMGWLKQRFSLLSSGSPKSKIKVLSGSVSGVASPRFAKDPLRESSCGLSSVHVLRERMWELWYLFFNWGTVALQHYVSFCCTTKWIGRMYTYTPSLLSLSPNPSPSHPTHPGHHRTQSWAPYAIHQGFFFL